MKGKHFKSIRSKIMLTNIIFALVFSMIVSGIVYVWYKELLLKNMTEITSANLNLVMDNIDKEFSQIESVLEWGTINNKLPRILTLENIDGENAREIVEFTNTFSDMMKSSQISENIEKVIIAGNTDVSMQLGTMYGSLKDVETLKNSVWFQEMYESNKTEWIGLVENKFEYANSEYIIPIVKSVYSNIEHRNIGYIMIGVNSNLPYTYLKEYSGYEDSEIVLCNAKGQIISDNIREKIGTSIDNYSQIQELLKKSSTGSVEWKENGKNVVAVFRKSKVTGWTIIQKLSENEIKQQKIMVVRLVGVLVCGITAIVVMISMLFSYYVNRPVKRIVKQIEKISEGDFSIDKTLETDDELGKIGYGINNMSNNIVSLMNKSINDEKNKRELELKVLQTQVNPHFLYNTLNSIKWMATIQKSEGIGEMAAALSRLLRNMAKGVSDQIEISDELSLVQDYTTIQQFRYGESFKVEYDVDEKLKEYKIVKFTLQPIVENAIFHGIEPKGERGIVRITVKEEDETIIISVYDNGIVMDKECIQNILNKETSKNKDSLNGIGVNNVNERIKLVYGEEYGLKIESNLGEYTRIYIRIPKVK